MSFILVTWSYKIIHDCTYNYIAIAALEPLVGPQKLEQFALIIFTCMYMYAHLHFISTPYIDLDYEELCQELLTEVSKEKQRVRKIMQETFNKRRQWILSDLPVVFDTFPPLKTMKYVSLSHMAVALSWQWDWGQAVIASIQ